MEYVKRYTTSYTVYLVQENPTRGKKCTTMLHVYNNREPLTEN